jgi:formylglycine-generating enzyme required for sulfatase activity
MKKGIYKIGERLLIVVAVIIVATAGVKALDKKMGQVAGVAEGECPDGMALVSAPAGDFCIDRYEAAPDISCPYAEPGNQSQSRENIQDARCLPVSEPGRLPWRYISQDQAAQACAKAGKRLPTNQEWYAAALGTPDPLSGWGQDDCNVNGNQGGKPAPAGSGANCVSAAGAYDMVGNAWEWVWGAASDGSVDGRKLPASGYVQSTDGQSFPAETDKESPNDNYNDDYFWIKETGYRGIARGGYWGNAGDAGLYALYIVSTPAEVGQGIGFRCVK